MDREQFFSLIVRNKDNFSELSRVVERFEKHQLVELFSPIDLVVTLAMVTTLNLMSARCDFSIEEGTAIIRNEAADHIAFAAFDAAWTEIDRQLSQLRSRN